MSRTRSVARAALGTALLAACASSGRATPAVTPATATADSGSRDSTPGDTIRTRLAGTDSTASDSTSPEGPLKHTATPTSAPITPADLRSRLYVFADDSMMGREAGTQGNVKATDYLAAQARQMGLEPAGENGTWFQTVPLVAGRLDPASTLSVAGKRLALGTDALPLPILSASLPFGDSMQATRAVSIYAGRVGEDLSPGFLASTAGKLVVFSPPLGPDGKPLWRFFGGVPPLPKAAGIAVASLDITPPEVVDYFRAPHLTIEGDRAKGDTTEAGPGGPAAILLTPAVATRLFGKPLAGLTRGATGKPVSGTIRFTDGPTDAPARNVVAVLRGSDPALRNQYVALGAHNDHIGTHSTAVDHDSLRAFNTVARPEGANGPPAQPSAGDLEQISHGLDSVRALRPARADSIANGADDDGSGSVTLLEIAENLVKGRAKPKRSVLFVWHTGEEKGLYGSQWFTDHPTVPLDSIVAQINIDMVGRGSAVDTRGGGPRALGLVGSWRLSTELGDLIEQVNRDEGHAMRLDYAYDANGHPDNVYCRSDHYMYARYGVPIAFFSTGLHRDYHQVTDEPQYIDYAHMSRVASFVRDVTLAVADLGHRPLVDKPRPDSKAPCRQ
ncbi:MAG: M28 family peptidase [Gemmatimonadales bacterium]|nr:M28 family peptidase [Gemmatimonadales bacterium]